MITDMENKKVFYNFVIPEDLWNMVAYYYNRYGFRNKYDIHELCNMSLKDMKQFCDNGIKWLENTELPNVDVLDPEGYSPTEWVTLYYMALSYMYNSDCYYVRKKLHECNKEDLIAICNDTIKWLKEQASQIRELQEEDI